MIRTVVTLATTLWVLTGVGLLVLSRAQSGVTRTVLASYGLVLLNLAVLDRVLAPKGRGFFSTTALRHAQSDLGDLLADVIASIRNCVRSRVDAVWLAVTIGLGIVVRGYSLGQPIWYDEAYTFLNFVQPGFPALFNYPLPNNHVLHTILVHFSTLIFGSYPASIRVPAFLAGVATIPLTFLLCRKILPERSGYLATTAVSTTVPYLIFYSAMARGYTLLVALTLALAFVGLHVIKKPSSSGCGALSLIGALGMLTIPTMLFALGGVYLWLAALLLVERQSLRTVLRDFVAPCVIMTGLLTVVLYTPSIIESDGVQSIVANSFVQPLPWQDFSRAFFPHVQSTGSQLFWNFPSATPAICACLVLAGMLCGAFDRNWAVVLLAPSILIGAGMILLAKQSIPFPRTWIYLIPFAAIGADAGLTYAMQAVPRRARGVLPGLLLAVGLDRAVTIMDQNLIARGADFHQGSRIAQALKSVMNFGDIVHVRSPVDWPLYFYMWHYGIPDKIRSGTQRRAEFFVVEQRLYSITDLTREPVVLIAEYDGADLYQLLDTDHAPQVP